MPTHAKAPPATKYEIQLDRNFLATLVAPGCEGPPPMETPNLKRLRGFALSRVTQGQPPLRPTKRKTKLPKGAFTLPRALRDEAERYLALSPAGREEVLAKLGVYAYACRGRDGPPPQRRAVAPEAVPPAQDEGESSSGDDEDVERLLDSPSNFGDAVMPVEADAGFGDAALPAEPVNDEPEMGGGETSADAVRVPPGAPPLPADAASARKRASAKIRGPVPIGLTESAPKRQRTNQKRPNPAWDILPNGWAAVLPEQCTQSRLSRELGCEVYAAQFGCLGRKPLRLRLWRGQGNRPWPATLYLLAGKEDGTTYYTSRDLAASPSAIALLGADQLVAKAYSRLPLLLSPSTTFCPVAELVRVEPDARSDTDDVSTDGQAELGIEAARALGLLAPGTVPDRCPAWQFRAVLPVEDGGLCLAKGMLMVNPDLGGKLALRESCVKARFPRVTTIQTGLDVVKDTRIPFAAPLVNAQLCIALRLRLLEARNKPDAEEAWKRLMTDCEGTIADRLARRAFTSAPPTGPDGADAWLQRRPAQHDINVVVTEEAFDTDDVDALSVTAEEEAPWRLDAGTRDSARRGAARAYGLAVGLRRTPRLSLSGEAFTLTALSCPWPGLGAKQCHLVTEDGKIRTGRVAVWRSPVVLPSGVEVWQAVAPPPGVKPLPLNAILCAREHGTGSVPSPAGTTTATSSPCPSTPRWCTSSTSPRAP